MVKRCFKCGKKKVLSQFYVHPRMADGHLNKCKSCVKLYVLERSKTRAGREKIRAYDRLRFTFPSRKLQMSIYREKRRLNSPGRYRANYAVNNAIRDGRLVRMPCEKCGSPKSQAHHNDYRKVFDVRWLCFRHHRELHGQITGKLPY